MTISIALIRRSYSAIKPHGEDFSAHFVEELVRRLPAAASLAKGSVDRGRRELLATLGYLVVYDGAAWRNPATGAAV